MTKVTRANRVTRGIRLTRVTTKQGKACLVIEELQEMEDEVGTAIHKRVNKARQLGCKETLHR